MLDKYAYIQKKLKFVGLYSSNARNDNKISRTALALMRLSDEQSEMVIQILCEVDPLLAAKCASDSGKLHLYKNIILNSVCNSNINEIKKLIIFYKCDSFSEHCSVPDEIDLSKLVVEDLFGSWKDFCGFICWLVDYINSEYEWLYNLFTSFDFSVSAILQNKNDTKRMIDSLLERGCLRCILDFYNTIGLDSFYSLTEFPYENIYLIFGNDEIGLREQLKYCWVDSVKRGRDLFKLFYEYNIELCNKPVVAYSALLYEYQVTDERDENFLMRCSMLPNLEISNRSAGDNKIWKGIIAKGLILCTRLCMSEKRNVHFFLNTFEKVNIFSFGTSMALGLDVISEEKIQIDETGTKNKFLDYVEKNQNADAIDLYLSSYLKFAISFDSAMNIIHKYIQNDTLNRKLKSIAFPAKIVHKDSSELIVRLRNLSSRAYSPYRDRLLCEEIDSNSKIFVSFKYSEEIGLYVSGVGIDAFSIVDSNIYSNYVIECISLIDKIARDGVSEEILDRLSICSDVPMRYIKGSFESFLSALNAVIDNTAFMYVLSRLSWNKKYIYSAGTEYEKSDLDYYSKYKTTVQNMISKRVEYGLSKTNAVQIYMNSFFKLACSLDELYVFDTNEFPALFSKYVFVGNRDKNGIWKCVSTKDFNSLPFQEIDESSNYSTLDSCIFKLGYLGERVGLIFSIQDTVDIIIPRRIDRMKRAYDALSKSVSVKEYEYDYINMISPDFYRSNYGVCLYVSEMTIEGTNIRHKSFSSTKTLIEKLGLSNIYGAKFYPISNFISISRFAKMEDGKYDIARRLCHSYIRCCNKLSEAMYLYMNTYIKNNISFKEFEEMCMQSELIKDSFSDSMYILLELKISESHLCINSIDVSIENISNMDDILFGNLELGLYYAELCVSYDCGFNYVIKAIQTIDNHIDIYKYEN